MSINPSRFVWVETLYKPAALFAKLGEYLKVVSPTDYTVLDRQKIQIIDRHVKLKANKVTQIDATLVKYIPGAFDDFLPLLNCASDEFLVKAEKIPEDDKEQKGITKTTFHFGRWERRGNPEQVCKLMRKNKFARDYVKAVRQVSARVDRYFQLNFPELWPFLKRVTENDAPGNVSRVYRMFALNDSISTWHMDQDDYTNGFCAIIPFGDFEGGELLLPDIRVKIPARAGDLIFLRSCFMIHQNAPLLSGHRRSLVYYTHQLAVSRYLMKINPDLQTTQHALDFSRENWCYKDPPIKKQVSFKVKQVTKKKVAVGSVDCRSDIQDVNPDEALI